ncbi:hypothetical protein HID58_077744 [Brassica napus]|uniref:Uncharacterized protein n=1 Tax=Brassica napus TaxID=3708 RepID=A0ABQ7YR78_BRANA|nr:hypothetical protein HID58_077744 [Brassica napus]
MSTNKSFTLLHKVKPYKNRWCVQVKLIHSPKQNPYIPDETLEIDGKIHASCTKTHMFWTQRNLPIGEWLEKVKPNIEFIIISD